MAQNQNFGVMDEGYFVPRSEIITWVNELLKLNLSKIEQLGSGAVYCQLLDAVHPGKISLSKVNWKARIDYEFLNNYKILQNAFDKFAIKRYIDVERLSKAKYQDNLEFIQWLKRYYEINGTNKIQPYNAEERRGTVKIDFSFADKSVVPKNFNAGGQVIPKNRVGSKQKRGEHVTSGQKESTKRLASPQIPHKPKTTSQQKKEHLNQHTSKQIKRPQTSAHLPPTPNRNKQEHKPETPEEAIRPNRASAEQLEKYKKMVRDLESKLEMIAEIAQTGDDAEMKMKLIEEVLSIGQSKLSRLSEQEAIKSVRSPSKRLEESPTQPFQVSPTQQIEESPAQSIEASPAQKTENSSVKHLKTVKTEEIEIIPQSIHINQSVPQQANQNTLSLTEPEQDEEMSESKLVSESQRMNGTIKSAGEEQQAF